MSSSEKETLRTAKFRLCRLKKWPNYKGLGFGLEAAPEAPHLVQIVESNSPAAAAGLRILDAILAVNKDDTTKVTFEKLKALIKSAVDKQDTVEFLVIEKRHYDSLKKSKVNFDRKHAQPLESPSTMPRDYASFQQNTPRTCDIRLGPQDPSLGLELVTGKQDTGAYVQDITSDSPASRANVRKSDRIIEMDGDFVDNLPYSQITARLRGAKANGGVKLYVMDTATYKHYNTSGIPLASGRGQDDDEQPVDGDGSERKNRKVIVRVVRELLLFFQVMTMLMSRMTIHPSCVVANLKLLQTIFVYAASLKRVLPKHTAWHLRTTKCNDTIR